MIFILDVHQYSFNMDAQSFLSILTTFTVVNKTFISDNQMLITCALVCIIIYNNYKTVKTYLTPKQNGFTRKMTGSYFPLFNNFSYPEMGIITGHLSERSGEFPGITIVNLTRDISFPVTNDYPIAISDDLFFSSTMEISQSDNNIHFYKLSLSFYGKSSVINAYIDKCIKEYSSNVLKNPKIFYIESQGEKIVFNHIDFVSKKSFDNIFFTGKDILIKKILDFEDSSNRYVKLGIPYNFGMMFHGKPGTAKTSCAKAISTLTGRHIISISLGKIKNINDLRNIILSENVSGVKIPTNKRLYVFDEADCNLFSKRTPSEEKSPNIVDVLSSKLDIKYPPEIPIGEVLELLDGLVETYGRMIIFITNHPEKLDPALVRPGRIDEIIEFGHMSKNDIANMFNLWFDERLPSDIIEKINEDRYTLADIGKIFRSNSIKDIKAILETSKISNI